MDGKPFEPKRGWDVGERPTVPMPYFRLPEHKFVEAHLRRAPPGAPELRRPPECRDLEFSSREPHEAQVQMHARRDYQRRPGEGWLSKLHPKTLDYRTVDELGMHPDELALDRKPAKEFPTLRIVETVFHGDEVVGRAKPARQLESGKKAYGSVEQFSYQYFKVTAAHTRTYSLCIARTLVPAFYGLAGDGALQEHDGDRARDRSERRPRHLRMQPQRQPDAGATLTLTRTRTRTRT